MRNLIFGISCILLFGSFKGSEILSIEKKTEKCGCNIVESIKHFENKKSKLKESVILIQNLLPELPNEQVKEIASRLCSDLYQSDTVGFSEERFMRIIAKAIGLGVDTPNIRLYISKFLNDNKQNLICSPDITTKDNRSKLYYKAAMLKGVTELFEKVLLDDEKYTIDFNGYEIVDGKQETVLDYIDKLLTTNHFDKIQYQMIQMEIEELGGKRGNEL